MLSKMINQRELPSSDSHCNTCLARCSSCLSLDGTSSSTWACPGNRSKTELRDCRSVLLSLPLNQRIALKSCLCSRTKRTASWVLPIPPSPCRMATFRDDIGEFRGLKYCHRPSSSACRPTKFSITGTAVRSNGILKRSTGYKNQHRVQDFDIQGCNEGTYQELLQYSVLQRYSSCQSD